MMNKGSFKSLFSFEFWQKFGKALMGIILSCQLLGC